MQITLLIISIVLGVLLVRRLLASARGIPETGHERDRRTGFAANDPFHAVSILPTEAGCAAAESIKVQRFLSEDAPGLPLPDCGAVSCHCKYIHYADRRSGARDRRLSPAEKSGEFEPLSSLQNRRVTAGRRQEDRQVT